MLGAWRQLNATFRICLCAAVVILAIFGVRRILVHPALAPIGSSTVQQTYEPPAPARSIPASKADLPWDVPAHRYRGRVTVVVRDTTRAADGTAEVHEHKVDVLIPRDDAPPLVRTDAGTAATSSYTRIRQPWIRWAPGLLLGAAVGSEGRASPELGVVALRVARRIDLGLSATRSGLGPVIGLEIWREWTLTGSWQALRRHGAGAAAVGFCYRF